MLIDQAFPHSLKAVRHRLFLVSYIITNTKSILVPVYRGKDDPLVCVSYKAIKLLEQPMKVFERVLASFLAMEALMPFSSCDKYKRNTK